MICLKVRLDKLHLQRELEREGDGGRERETARERENESEIDICRPINLTRDIKTNLQNINRF